MELVNPPHEREAGWPTTAGADVQRTACLLIGSVRAWSVIALRSTGWRRSFFANLAELAFRLLADQVQQIEVQGKIASPLLKPTLPATVIRSGLLAQTASAILRALGDSLE